MLGSQTLNNPFSLPVLDSSTEVIIFANENSPRLQYTLGFIFRQLGLRYKAVYDKTSFLQFNGPKVNYTDSVVENTVNIFPSGFLFQTGVSEIKPEVKLHDSFFYLFPNNSDLGFDLFSAVFFMISRYEEWLPFEKDAHGRFEIKESILYKNNFHLKPVVDIWIQNLRAKLLRHNSEIIFSERNFTTVASLDIDNLFAYKNKGFFRTAGAFGKDIFEGNFKNAARRMKVVQGKTSDPFDIYEDISCFCETHSIPLICFFLMASGTAFDRSVDPDSNAYDNVFDTLRKHKALIGIHPSYYSERNDLLSDQKKKIEERIKSSVTFSRQHYLRFCISTTPDYLISKGISFDFTMGFAASAGFRAGTSFPFCYYDFKKEECSELLMIPFCAMDGAYMVYENKSSENACAELLSLKNEVRKVNGFFTTVFHERTFDDTIAPGFGEMYRRLLLA